MPWSKEKDAEYKRKLRAKNRAAGLCNCGNKLDNHTKTCTKCKEAVKRSIAKNRAKKLCLCGRKPSGKNRMCDRCLTWNRKRNFRNKRNGLCKCGGKKEYWWVAKCEKCKAYNKRYRDKIGNSLKSLYRPATEEEKRRYGGKSARKILKEYYDILY